MIARWLVGLKDDTISAQKTFRMLNAHITSKGDLHESGKLRYLIEFFSFLTAVQLLKLLQINNVHNILLDLLLPYLQYGRMLLAETSCWMRYA